MNVRWMCILAICGRSWKGADRTLIQTVRGVGYLFAARPEQSKVEHAK